jgi:hypothetical protein
MKSLTITFNSKKTGECARTFLTNQNAPYRNTSIEDEETYSVTFSSQHWANRAEKELLTYFNNPLKSTHNEPYVLYREQ